MSWLRLTALGLCLVPGFVGCASVLGIEEATLDPKLDKGGANGAGGSENGGGGSGGTVDGGGGGKTLCETYCDTVSAACAGQFEQYVSPQTCMKLCGRLDPGQPGDDSGDTVNCRLHYAESAQTAGEKTSNCSAAGPGGHGTCGTNCDALCRIALDTCRAQRIFSSTLDCASQCTKIPDLGHYDDSIQDGDSVQCRLYHVSAAQIDPVIHCPHVAGIVKCVHREGADAAP